MGKLGGEVMAVGRFFRELLDCIIKVLQIVLLVLRIVVILATA